MTYHPKKVSPVDAFDKLHISGMFRIEGSLLKALDAETPELTSQTFLISDISVAEHIKAANHMTAVEISKGRAIGLLWR